MTQDWVCGLGIAANIKGVGPKSGCENQKDASDIFPRLLFCDHDYQLSTWCLPCSIVERCYMRSHWTFPSYFLHEDQFWETSEEMAGERAGKVGRFFLLPLSGEVQ